VAAARFDLHLDRLLALSHLTASREQIGVPGGRVPRQQAQGGGGEGTGLDEEGAGRPVRERRETADAEGDDRRPPTDDRRWSYR